MRAKKVFAVKSYTSTFKIGRTRGNIIKECDASVDVGGRRVRVVYSLESRTSS